ncbi:hypothetical protein J2X48_002484 [Bosea sp. BE271]|uniref:DUF2971 domain-containing protein n=1 Tax=Bosea TaxID=85413 RepID=UPI002857A6DC|nr:MULTISPECIES: DUF2971 domain-containing protein [Bosea]MDR6830798.1 hypothetical protein [Bosea robiniae]MDR6895455.1 hypothetical protein [Bosea sp. BE109]MDR7138851.1 hypothetical protein [Bosea sp. BE168]MDR7175552.1 hypothetical protein [Bosea sp. BE271]
MYRLSHYTTPAGLEGIATSRTLWATNFRTVEDRSELFYAWKILSRAALAYVVERVPADLIPDFVDPTDEQLAEEYRRELDASEHYGHLFMASFVRHGTEDEERRGSLTHWRTFSKLNGYCLQFDDADIRLLIDLDTWRSSYGLIELRPITYGVNTETGTYRELVIQLGRHQLQEVAKQLADRRIKFDLEGCWAPSHLLRTMMQYCASHKDPSFKDEREVRIMAFPVNATTVQFLTGAAFAKPISSRPDGKRYIALGEGIRPAIGPRRIIIGPQANPDIEHIVAKFPERPEILRSDIPV